MFRQYFNFGDILEEVGDNRITATYYGYSLPSRSHSNLILGYGTRCAELAGAQAVVGEILTLPKRAEEWLRLQWRWSSVAAAATRN